MTKYPHIVKHEPINENGFVSLLIAFSENMVLWFDAHKNEDGEITGDWNQYIFFTDNEDDMAIKAFQEANNDEVGAYNYMTALELAETLFDNLS